MYFSVSISVSVKPPTFYSIHPFFRQINCLSNAWSNVWYACCFIHALQTFASVAASATVLRYTKPARWCEMKIQRKRKWTQPNSAVSVSNFSVSISVFCNFFRFGFHFR